MEIIACVFLVGLGALGHFIFEWSGHKKWSLLLFAVNESTWEHIKLAILPSFLWLGVEIIVRGWSASLVVASFASLCVTIILIPALFYGYTAITRKNWLITDILCFVFAVVLGRLAFVALLDFPAGYDMLYISRAGLLAVAVAFFTFSIKPPHNFLFKDPVSGGFGPQGHDCHNDFHVHNSSSHHHHHS